MNVDDAWQRQLPWVTSSLHAPPTGAEEEEAGRRLGDVDSRRRLRAGGGVVRMSQWEVLALQAQWSAQPASNSSNNDDNKEKDAMLRRWSLIVTNFRRRQLLFQRDSKGGGAMKESLFCFTV